jgi:hypothetical protein
MGARVGARMGARMGAKMDADLLTTQKISSRFDNPFSRKLNF